MTKRLVIGPCDHCKKESFHFANSIVTENAKDQMTLVCCRCSVAEDVPFKYVENRFTNFMPTELIVKNPTVLKVVEDISQNFSATYMKQDLFYILFNYHCMKGVKSFNIGDMYDDYVKWEFFFRVPNYTVSFKNYRGPVFYISTDKLPTNMFELEADLNFLMTYLVNELDTKEHGFVNNMLISSSLNPDADKRIAEISKFFKKSQRYTGGTSTGYTTSTSTYASYITSAVSPTVLTAMNNTTSVSTMIPKTTNKGTTWSGTITPSPKRKTNIRSIATP
jgi:hypothetical protein